MPTQQKSYQDWAMDMMEQIIAHQNDYRGDFGDQAYYSQAGVRGILEHYASSYWVLPNREHKVIYKDYATPKNISYFFAPLIMSRGAFDLWQEVKDAQGIRTKDLKKFHQSVFLEHATPVASVLRKLEQIRPNSPTMREEIEKAFAQSKLIALLQKQNEYLDKEQFTNEDYERLKKSNDAAPPEYRYSDELLQECHNIIGLSCRSNGIGIYRAIHLLNHSIELVDAKGNAVSYLDMVKYFADREFVIDARTV